MSLMLSAVSVIVKTAGSWTLAVVPGRASHYLLLFAFVDCSHNEMYNIVDAFKNQFCKLGDNNINTSLWW